MSDWQRKTYEHLMDRARYCVSCDSVYYTWGEWGRERKCECSSIPNPHILEAKEKNWGGLAYMEACGDEGPFYYFLKQYDVIWSTNAQLPHRVWDYRTQGYISKQHCVADTYLRCILTTYLYSFV